MKGGKNPSRLIRTTTFWRRTDDKRPDIEYLYLKDVKTKIGLKVTQSVRAGITPVVEKFEKFPCAEGFLVWACVCRETRGTPHGQAPLPIWILIMT